MFFKTESECRELAQSFGMTAERLIQRKDPCRACHGDIKLHIEDHRDASIVLATKLVTWMGAFRSSLFWVSEFGIWPSQENRHLYYRLRASYGDLRELNAAPGHYFLDYETADLITFVDLAIRFGWGASLISSPSWTFSFLSHDGWIRVEAESGTDAIRKDIDELSVSYEVE